MYCNKCGQEIDERDIYCPYCSSKVDNELIYETTESISDEPDSLDDSDTDTLIDLNTRFQRSESKNVDEEYEQYKQSIFNKNQMNDQIGFDEFDDHDGFKGIGQKLIIVLIVIAFVTATALAAKYFFFSNDSTQQPAQIPGDIGQAGDDINQEPDTPDIINEDDLTQREKVFQELGTLNYNIQEIRDNLDLQYNKDVDYKISDINTSVPISDEVWKTIEGKTYYYNEAIIKALIQFNSKWIDYVNNNDKTVISLVEKDSKAYKNVVTFNREGTLEEFLLFEIGEIRRGEKGYYVWTHEKIKVVKDGESDIREYNWIYQLIEGEYDFFISNYYGY